MRGWDWLALALVVGLLLATPGEAAAKRLEAVRLPGLALMPEPKDGGKMLRALRAGETVTVLGRHDPWVEVVLPDGTRGFVQGGFLTGFPDIAPIAAYAGRMDASVVRPAQSGSKTTAETPKQVAAKTSPGVGIPDSKSLQATAPAVKKVASMGQKAPYVPVADGGGIKAFLEDLVRPRPAHPASSETALSRKSRYFIEVHLSQHRLYLFENRPDGSRRLVQSYLVAVPSRDMEAPEGWGVVTGISFKPWWVPTQAMRARARKKGKTLPERVRPGVKANPMGTFKIILSHGSGFRIHGNNNPSSIGHSVTSGCIRMRNDEGKKMAQMIDVGTEVVFSR